jgi:hypothetical protein
MPVSWEVRMLSLRLVRLIETNSDRLAERLLGMLSQARECSELRKVPPDHFRARAHEIYRNLGSCLISGSDVEIARRYEALGMERAEQDVALSHVIWAIHASKRNLRDFLETEGLADSPIELNRSLELLALLDRFFDTAIYYVTLGYERQQARRHKGVGVAHT